MTRLISNLPQIVKKYRKDNGLTQAQFASLVRKAMVAAGVGDDTQFDHTFVSRIENNTDATRIDLGTVYKLKLVITSINMGNIAIEVD